MYRVRNIKFTFLLLMCFVQKIKSFSLVGNPQARAHPCNGTDIITETFESNQPPEDENKYDLGIDLKKNGYALPSGSKIKLAFDSEVNVTIKTEGVARISSYETLSVLIHFYAPKADWFSLTVRGRRGQPVPNILSVIINEDEICPNGVTKGIWDAHIIGDRNSAVSKDKVPLSSINCGKRLVIHTELITNGLETKPGDWPWHVALYKTQTSEATQTYICGGSLLNPTFILTAGHCVSENGVAIIPQRLFVVLGKYNLVGGDIGSQERSVYRITLHQDFIAANLTNDIALVKLATRMEYTEYIQPICLWPRDKVDKSNIYEKSGTVVGWGFSENNILSSELKQAKMPVVHDYTCLRSLPAFFDKFLSSSTYCAGNRNGTSVCNGDSGGGMYFSEKDGDEDVWFLRGLTSVSVSRKDIRVCDPNHYVIFTDIANYLDWIETNIKE